MAFEFCTKGHQQIPSQWISPNQLINLLVVNKTAAFGVKPWFRHHLSGDLLATHFTDPIHVPLAFSHFAPSSPALPVGDLAGHSADWSVLFLKRSGRVVPRVCGSLPRFNPSPTQMLCVGEVLTPKCSFLIVHDPVSLWVRTA